MAGVISGVLGEVVDAIAIFALNAVIDFYREFSAEKSIAALRKMTAPRAKVVRDGGVSVVPAAEVVPGDSLELEAGDIEEWEWKRAQQPWSMKTNTTAGDDRRRLLPAKDQNETNDSAREQGGAEDDGAGGLGRGGDDLRGCGGPGRGLGEAGRDQPEAEGDHGDGDYAEGDAHAFPYATAGTG